MRFQAFRPGDTGSQRRNLGSGSGIERDQADDMNKVPDIEWGSKASAAAGRHDVAGPSDIISKHFEGLFAHKDSASVGDFFAQCPGIIDSQTKMFGRIRVTECSRFV